MWNSISSAPNLEPVMTCIDDASGRRNEAPLVRDGRRWFLPDWSMYVYYQPTHWKPLGVTDSCGRVVAPPQPAPAPRPPGVWDGNCDSREPVK